MRSVSKLLPFIHPYRLPAVLSLVALVALVFLDLAIPRLIERIIDEGIAANNPTIVLQTGLIMLGISALSTLISIANNGLSVRVGESVARDIREALFSKIQSFSFGNLDSLKTGQLMVRLSSDTGAFARRNQREAESEYVRRRVEEKRFAGCPLAMVPEERSNRTTRSRASHHERAGYRPLL